MDAATLRAEKQREFYNQENDREGPDRFYSIDRASEDFYRRSLAEHGAGDVLEIGCAQGATALRLAGSARRVVGIDISDKFIEEGRALAESRAVSNVELRVMNAEAMTFAGESFDLVCGGAILHHLDLTRVFGEIARVLRSGGRAVFVECLGHNPLINLYRWLTPDQRTEDEHPLRMRDLALARQYFGRVEETYYHLASLAAVPLRRVPAVFNPVLSAFETVDRALFRALPALGRYAWMVGLVLSQPRMNVR